MGLRLERWELLINLGVKQAPRGEGEGWGYVSPGSFFTLGVSENPIRRKPSCREFQF